MLADLSVWAFLLIGFSGGGHCMAMCGGLSGAFALQLPPHVNRFWLIVLLNLGRLGSYTLIGLLLGTLGQFGISLDNTHTVQTVLFVLAQILMIFMALYLLGVSRAIVTVEHLGKPVWKRLNPLLTRLLPIRSVAASFGVGLLWGWLPCGLVYSASLYALASGSTLKGLLVMLFFGLGTLPNLLAMGWFAAQIRPWLQKRSLRIIGAIILLAWAFWQLVRLG